jgi:hypothetical protein
MREDWEASARPARPPPAPRPKPGPTTPAPRPKPGLLGWLPFAPLSRFFSGPIQDMIQLERGDHVAPARTPPTRVPVGGTRPVLAGGDTSGARASRAGLGGLFHPSNPLVCLLSAVARKTGGSAPKTTPRGSPVWGWGYVVETCEARGLGGGLRSVSPLGYDHMHE